MRNQKVSQNSNCSGIANFPPVPHKDNHGWGWGEFGLATSWNRSFLASVSIHLWCFCLAICLTRINLLLTKAKRSSSNIISSGLFDNWVARANSELMCRLEKLMPIEPFSEFRSRFEDKFFLYFSFIWILTLIVTFGWVVPWCFIYVSNLDLGLAYRRVFPLWARMVEGFQLWSMDVGLMVNVIWTGSFGSLDGVDWELVWKDDDPNSMISVGLSTRERGTLYVTGVMVEISGVKELTLGGYMCQE